MDPDDGRGAVGSRPFLVHPPHRLHRLQGEDLVHLAVRLEKGKEINFAKQDLFELL